MNNQRELIFSLSISADAYLEYYKGSVKHVLAKSQDGRSVRFPANAIQKFLTHEGVHGRFRMLFDENHKLISIEKIEN